jgi:aminopeptidase YwaD
MTVTATRRAQQRNSVTRMPGGLASIVGSFAVGEARAALEALSSKRFAGRRLGTSGHDRARDWLVARMTALGLKVDVTEFDVHGILDLSAEPSLEILEGSGIPPGAREHRVAFAEHPRSASLATPLQGVARHLDGAGNAGDWVILEAVPQGQGLPDLAHQLALTRAVGILTPQFPVADGYLSKRIVGGNTVNLPVIAVRPDLLSKLQGAVIRAAVPLTRIDARGANVAGIIAGSDPDLNGQPLVIAAHYDGVGDDPRRRLPSSADNGSGVAVLLEVARVLATSAWRPPRPIIFVAVDGEEVGALGSRVHATALGNAGLQPHVLNLDMVARFRGPVAAEIGPGSEGIVAALDRAGEWLEIPLTVAQVASDNRSYAKAGFPAVGIGLGAASYHTPADTPDRVEDAALALAGRLAVATTWQLCREGILNG